MRNPGDERLPAEFWVLDTRLTSRASADSRMTEIFAAPSLRFVDEYNRLLLLDFG
jgi:hypothetical protein